MLNNEVNDQLRNKRDREQKGYQKSNRVYILGYSPDRLTSTKKTKWDLAQTKHDKPAHLLLKKQALKQKNQLLEPTQGQINHRSNINRLINLISRSRTFVKTSDSGCQKMVRALSKLLDKFYPSNQDRTNIGLGFQSLKRYTMTCSSNNYELFIQSKHNNFKEITKLTNLYSSRQPRLQQICQNIEETPVNSQSSQFNIPLNLLEVRTPTNQFTPNDEGDSFTFKKIQSPKIYTKWRSSAYLTTRQQLSLQQTSSPKQNILYQAKASNSIKLPFCKAFTGSNFQQQTIETKFSFQQQAKSKNMSSFQKQQFGQEQDATLYMSSQDMINKLSTVTVNKLINNKSTKEQKPNSKVKSPIMSLMYAIPTSINQQKQVNTQTTLDSRVNNNSLNASPIVQYQQNKNMVFRKQDKKQIVLSPSRYAQRMLFGQTQNAQKNIQKQNTQKDVQKHKKAPVLLQSSRKRISSLPKITFTYASRQKYFGQAVSPQPKQTFIPMVNDNNSKLPNLKKSMSNTSKEELHSTFQSKRTAERSNHRTNITINQGSPFQSERIIRSPANRQRITVTPMSPRLQNPFPNQFGTSPTPHLVRTQYYGDNAPIKGGGALNAVIDRSRQRILTIQPNWKNQVEFVAIQQQLPNCCWQKRQGRAQSLNERVLVGLHTSNKFHF